MDGISTQTLICAGARGSLGIGLDGSCCRGSGQVDAPVSGVCVMRARSIVSPHTAAAGVHPLLLNRPTPHVISSSYPTSTYPSNCPLNFLPIRARDRPFARD